MKSLLLFLFLVFSIYSYSQLTLDVFKNLDSNCNIFIVKNKNSCLNCFIDLEKKLKTLKIENYSLVILKSNSYIDNIQELQKMKSIYSKEIFFIQDSLFKQEISPIIYYIDNDILNLLSYNQLFINGKLNDSKLVQLKRLQLR